MKYQNFSRTTRRLIIVFASILIAWTLIIGLLLNFSIIEINRNSDKAAKTEAIANFNKDQAIRLWATSHGGVYVPTDSATPPNQYLSHIKERDIETKGGKKLTLMNPAYMVRQLNEHFARDYGIVGHITSLKLLRPENKPDAWERKALEQFEKGIKEIGEYDTINGVRYYRLIQPMEIVPGCLKCHGYQDYKVGDVRGGVSVSIPMREIDIHKKSEKTKTALIDGIIWIIVSIIIFTGFIKAKEAIKIKENADQLLSEKNNEILEKNEQLENFNKELESQVAERTVELNKAKDHLEKFFSLVPALVTIASPDGYLTNLNPEWEKVLGYTVEELESKPYQFLIHPDDIEPTNLEVAKQLQGSTTVNFNNRYRHKDGSYRWFEWKAFASEDGLLFAAARDTTESKHAEQKLIIAKEHSEESDRLKSAFLANMSHEIRTPMNGILGFAEILKEPNLTDKQQQEYIQIIETSGIRMLSIINDIIDISKIEAGLMEVHLKESNINDQLEYILTFFKPEAEKKGIQLTVNNSLPGYEAIIITDSEKVCAVLTNLVKNAVKFTSEGSIEFGYNLVETDNYPSLLEFYVKDTGHGIPKNRQTAIFERFIQADIIDNMVQQGAGLGLSITKAYIAMLGGKIWVESEEGKGSIFYFTLPYHTKPK